MLPSKLASPSTTPPEKPHLESRVSFCAQQTPGVQFLSNNSAAVVSPTKKLPSLKLTASLHLKFHGWKMYFLLGWPIFRGLCSFQGVVHVFFCSLKGRVPAKGSLYGIFRVYLQEMYSIKTILSRKLEVDER